MANRAMDGEEVKEWYMWDRDIAGTDVFRIVFDGGKRESTGRVGSGWVVDVGKGGKWKPVFRGCQQLPANSTVMDAELFGCEQSIKILQSILAPWTNEI